MVLFRDRKHLAAFYSSDPEYLRDAAAENGEINYWEWGIELTRPARSLKLWLTLQTLVTDQISDMVTHGIDLAQQTESMLRNQPEWEVVTPTQLAIVKFCYAPQGLTPPSNRTNYFSAHDGGRLCLRADHPAERPDRSADLPDPPEDNGGRYPPYDTAYVPICPCAEKGTCVELFLNYMP